MGLVLLVLQVSQVSGSAIRTIPIATIESQHMAFNPHLDTNMAKYIHLPNALGGTTKVKI